MYIYIHIHTYIHIHIYICMYIQSKMHIIKNKRERDLLAAGLIPPLPCLQLSRHVLDSFFLLPRHLRAVRDNTLRALRARASASGER